MSDHQASAAPSDARTRDLTRDAEAASLSRGSSGFDVSDRGSGETAAPLSLPAELGDYTVTQLIGSGGMGQVYRAEHRRMARTVALKTLAPQRTRDERAVERFHAEVRAAARVLHPNVVTAFDAGQIGEVHYLAMEFITGQTFARLIAERGPMPEADAVRYVCQAAEGLRHAHTAGIVHRDVKPSNLMLTDDGAVKVLDLGLAAFSQDAQRKSLRGKLVGTIEFMSPEQIADPDAADPRSDVYSLGATLFYLLTGRSPYAGGLLDQARAHRDSPPPELFRLRPNCDLRLDHVFQRMMAKAPEHRYTSMCELLEDLRALEGSVSGRSAHPVAAFLSASHTTAQGLSTASQATAILGIDLGMFHAAAAVVEAGRAPVVQAAGDRGPLLRCAISDHGDGVRFGDAAMLQRLEHPEHVTHCLQFYTGRTAVDRRLAGRRCPPEALLGMLLRQIAGRAASGSSRPAASAVSVPACYDQLHRRSILRAAQIAGLPAPRLVDRPLAAARSQLIEAHACGPIPQPADIGHWIVVTVAGNAMEVAVLQHLGGRFHTLAAVGNWTLGVLAWQQRLVDLAAADAMRRFGQDPRRELKSAAALQLACERALRMLLIQPATAIEFPVGRHQARVPLSRESLYVACRELFERLESMIDEALAASRVDPAGIDRCLLVGPVARFPRVSESIQRQVGHPLEYAPVDQPALASGVAAVAAEAIVDHGPGDLSSGCAPYDLGLLVHHERSPGRRAAVVVPRFAALPARTERRVRRKSGGRNEEMVFVEAAAGEENAWRALGTWTLPQSDAANPVEARFEVDSSGLLHVTIRDPATGLQQPLGALPASPLGPEEIANWRDWVEETLMSAGV